MWNFTNVSQIIFGFRSAIQAFACAHWAPTDEEAEDALDASIIVSRKDEEMEPLEDAIKELCAARKWSRHIKACTVLIAKTVKRKLPALIRTYLWRIKWFGRKSSPSTFKKLKGDLEYGVRVGDYRVLCTIEDSVKIAGVYKVGHRRDVYR